MIFLPCFFKKKLDNGLIGGLIFLEAAKAASFFRDNECKPYRLSVAAIEFKTFSK